MTNKDEHDYIVVDMSDPVNDNIPFFVDGNWVSFDNVKRDLLYGVFRGYTYERAQKLVCPKHTVMHVKDAIEYIEICRL